MTENPISIERKGIMDRLEPVFNYRAYSTTIGPTADTPESQAAFRYLLVGFEKALSAGGWLYQIDWNAPELSVTINAEFYPPEKSV